MKALPLELVPDVARYARELARAYGLPWEQWNIGVDLIVYKDGEDSIGWHAGENGDVVATPRVCLLARCGRGRCSGSFGGDFL